MGNEQKESEKYKESEFCKNVLLKDFTWIWLKIKGETKEAWFFIKTFEIKLISDSSSTKWFKYRQAAIPSNEDEEFRDFVAIFWKNWQLRIFILKFPLR